MTDFGSGSDLQFKRIYHMFSTDTGKKDSVLGFSWYSNEQKNCSLMEEKNLLLKLGR